MQAMDAISYMKSPMKGKSSQQGYVNMALFCIIHMYEATILIGHLIIWVVEGWW
jgi:hypothetical protein